MSDQWFYRVFGEEFGPMPLEKLKDLAASGTIQALDDVRSNAGSWVPAVTIDELGLSTSERRSLTAVATPSSDFDVVVPAATDEWYYQIGGKELGPVGFDQLLEFATQEQLGADDQVKLGAGGKWRRVGSIGRLVAALPYAAVEQTIAPTARKPASRSADVIRSVGQSPSRAASPSQAVTSVPAAAPVQAGPSVEATYRVAYEQAAVKVAESIIIQAEAAFKAAEEQALSMVAWATQPGVDRYWWGWCNAVEFGPVEFSQVMGLAKSGQLKPSDFVRNGQFGQFIPTSSLPGLLNAVATLAHAAEARELADRKSVV